MEKMYKLFVAIIFVLFAFNCYAQTDSLLYLNKALAKLEAGDCEAARKFYNVYKEVYNNNKSVPSVELLLDECTKEMYSVGETITKNGVKYIVAYTRDGGKHGLAVYNKGWGAIDDLWNDAVFDKYVTRKGIPTLEELKLIYNNRDVIRFYDIYWSCTPKAYGSRQYIVIDFSTGKVDEKYKERADGVILLVYRF